MGTASVLGQRAAAPWRQLLQQSLDSNKSLPYSKYLQLATVRTDGRPANRTVVFRGFLNATDGITFATDKRSAKVSEVAANPNAEVCWYFPNSREQYRLSGTVGVVDDAVSDEALQAARHVTWKKMSDAGRSQFLWPQPCQPRIPDNEHLFTQPAPESAGEPVPNFCIMVMKVFEVDHVELFTNKRTVFKLHSAPGKGNDSKPLQQWTTEEVNP
eukprot:jgi/Chrzof1/411/Cz01g14250.t1